MNKLIFVPLLLVMTIISCKKWSDPEAQDDPRINSKTYCNDPEAVNYNWDFPGVPDNSTCIYPADVFTGTYLYTDSVYNADNLFDSAGSLVTYTLQVYALSKNKLSVKGFCGPNDSLRFTAPRAGFIAYGDSTIQVDDTTFGYGQFFCSSLDTLTGTLMKQLGDSSPLNISFLVVSDTGINYHRGRAIKQ